MSSDRQLTGRELYEAYWSGLIAHPARVTALAAGRTPPRTHWMAFGLDCSGVFLEASIAPKQRTIAVSVSFFGPHARERFRSLTNDRPAIQDLIASPIEWIDRPEKRAYYASVQHEADCGVQSAWPECYAWMWQQIIALRDAFDAHIEPWRAEARML